MSTFYTKSSKALVQCWVGPGACTYEDFKLGDFTDMAAMTANINWYVDATRKDLRQLGYDEVSVHTQHLEA